MPTRTPRALDPSEAQRECLLELPGMLEAVKHNVRENPILQAQLERVQHYLALAKRSADLQHRSLQPNPSDCGLQKHALQAVDAWNSLVHKLAG